jgi:hypothetical protein
VVAKNGTVSLRREKAGSTPSRDEGNRAAAAEDEGGRIGKADAIGLEPLDELPPCVDIVGNSPVRVTPLCAHCL